MPHPNDLTVQLRAWKAGGATDLAEGMRLVAAYQYSDLTPEKWQARLAAFYAEVTAAYKPADDPEMRVKNLNKIRLKLRKKCVHFFLIF